MNFCLEDGTPLLSAGQFSNATENFSDRTLNLPTAPYLPTIAPTQGVFEQVKPPVTGQANLPTVEMRSQPTIPRIIEPSPVFTSLAEPENSKSRGNLAIAGLVGALLIGTAAGGVWLFSQRENGADVALSNVSNRNSATFPNKSSNVEAFNGNSSATFDNRANISVKSNSGVNTKLASPNPANTIKQAPPKTIEDTPDPKSENSGGGGGGEETPPDKSEPSTPKAVPKIISGGIVNGKATNLVKPPYPPAARAVRASGTVNVQVTIDESGNVIAASAVSGHPLLRASAVQAARSSKFSPTMLAGQPVKVTGVIVYNFVP